MTTREFIKMLQEADPSGNAHIRMSGGVPGFAELKEGYWDDPYSYIDEDGKEHSSNVYNVEGVYKSGLFERLDNNVKPGYYEWIKK